MSGESAVILRPIRHGWGVYMTDGRELAQFRGPGARTRAMRYLYRLTCARWRPRPASG
jgi:hypothetical protein